MNLRDRTLRTRRMNKPNKPRPLGLYARVTVPAPLYAPQTFSLRLDQMVDHREGIVVEMGENLVAVRFDGFPNIVDYSKRESERFLVMN